MVKGHSLKEWQTRPAEKPIKLRKCKPLTKPGDYNLRLKGFKASPDETRVYVTGSPFRINKSGEFVEYETVTFYIPIEYTSEETAEPYKELCTVLDVDPEVGIAPSEIKNKVVVVTVDIVDYVNDETGELQKRFFNALHFDRFQEQVEEKVQ